MKRQIFSPRLSSCQPARQYFWRALDNIRFRQTLFWRVLVVSASEAL